MQAAANGERSMTWQIPSHRSPNILCFGLHLQAPQSERINNYRYRAEALCGGGDLISILHKASALSSYAWLAKRLAYSCRSRHAANAAAPTSKIANIHLAEWPNLEYY
jgi:hypothetical protein